MSRDLEQDALDDVLDFIEEMDKKNHPAYVEFFTLYQERDRRIEGIVNNMARGVVDVYYYYFDVERYDTREAWEAAVEVVVQGTVESHMVRIRHVQEEMTDQELREVDRHVSEFRRIVERIKHNNGSSRPSAREAATAGRGRTESRRSSTRIFKEDDVGGIRDGRGSARSRGDARAQAAENRLQDKYARDPNAHRDKRPRHEHRQEQRRQQLLADENKYITNLHDLYFYPRRPGQWHIPSYDPMTQLLFATIDKEGFVTFSIKEKKEVNAELHQMAIKHLLSPSRADDYVQGTQKRAVYRAGGLELDPSQVENEAVESILDEMRAAKQIDEKATFMDLDDKVRVDVLSRAASAVVKKMDLAESIKKAQLIQSGKIEEHQRNLSIYNLKIPSETRSRKDILMQVIGMYGKDISRDYDRQTGYLIPYSCLSILARCESPEQQQIYTNILTGMKKGDGTTQSIAYSLRDKKLPVPLFTRLNLIATKAINTAIHHLVGIGALTASSFVDDIDDLSEWLVGNVERGKLTNEQVNTINHYVVSQVANLVNPSVESLSAHLGNEDLEEVVRLKHQSLFMLEKGEIVYVPLLAGEMGLSMGMNEIDRREQHVFNGLYPSAKVDAHGGFHYLVTADGLWFKLIGQREDLVILEYVGLDG